MAIYTDERIAADIASSSPGYRRAAEYLSEVPDAETRDLIVAVVGFRRNMIGGIYSDAIWSEVQSWKRLGHVDTHQ